MRLSSAVWAVSVNNSKARQAWISQGTWESRLRHLYLSCHRERLKSRAQENFFELFAQKASHLLPAFPLCVWKGKTHHSAGVDDDDIVADEANIYTEGSLFRSQADASSAWKDAHIGEVNIYAEGNMSRSQAGASCAVDDPGGAFLCQLGEVY